MSGKRFYCPQIALGVLELPEAEGHHARTVLRLRAGQVVELFDGQGTLARGQVATLDRKRVVVSVEEKRSATEEERPLPIVLAVAMPKAARQDVLIEKCTELGVEAIRPILFERSVVRPKASRLDHWQKVAVAAAKQCGRLFLPVIAPPEPFASMTEAAGEIGSFLYGSTGPSARWFSEALVETRSGGRTVVVIGPEGGLTTEEVGALETAGARPVKLGRWTLRVETAAIAAAAAFAAMTPR